MTRTTFSTRTRCVLAIALFTAFVLAGCTEENGVEEEPVDMEAFQEALDAPGETYTPDEMGGDTDFRVKLLRPEDPQQTPPENRPYVILIYDATLEEPIVDADVEVTETWMPQDTHQHECFDAQDPVHDANGVYEGRIHIGMPGQCDVTLRGERPNGDFFELVIEFYVPE